MRARELHLLVILTNMMTCADTHAHIPPFHSPQSSPHSRNPPYLHPRSKAKAVPDPVSRLQAHTIAEGASTLVPELLCRALESTYLFAYLSKYLRY